MAAGFLPTFEPAVKSWSLAERSAAVKYALRLKAAINLKFHT
jgi:hypothetical protein